MKTSRNHGQIMDGTSSKTKISAKIGCATAKAPMKKTGGRLGKSKGQSGSGLVGKEGETIQCALGEPISKQQPIEGACFSQSEDLTPKLELKETLRHTPKIKIQFFPIDKITQTGLEKDGHNPHLELILSDRKKIASVLRHLQSKWGGSSIAVGELMLFPYNIRPENLGGCMKWTMEDCVTSAADVYAAIGRPSIFCLRYGWLSNMESKSCTPFASSCLEGDCSEHENLQKDCSMNVEATYGEKQLCELDGQENTPITLGDVPDTVDESQKTSRIGAGLTLSSSLWTDNLTNISIGGLLSEVSLNAPGCADTRPSGIESQIPFSSDSFDAAIAAHIYGRRGLLQPTQNSICSLLDAEETCHPFPFQKSSLSRQDVLASGKSAPSTSTQDVPSTSYHFPNLVEASNHTGIPQDDECQGQKADLPTCTHEMSPSSNLGLSDINWSDSLGPLDLGLSSCRQLTGGDSISFGGLLTSSLDAFQNCSLFARDEKVTP